MSEDELTLLFGAVARAVALAEAEATIARVRALAGAAEEDAGYLWSRDVLAALDGPTDE